MELPKGQALQAVVQTRVLYASGECCRINALTETATKGQAQQPARESHIVNALIVATAEGQALQAPRKADII